MKKRGRKPKNVETQNASIHLNDQNTLSPDSSESASIPLAPANKKSKKDLGQQFGLRRSDRLTH